MVNIHTDDRVLKVKTFSSFKVNPTQKICSSICFFSFLFFGKSLFYRREGGGGREGVRWGCSEDFWGIAWFSGEAEMILVFGNIIYKGRTVDNRLQMMEGGGGIIPIKHVKAYNQIEHLRFDLINHIVFNFCCLY